MILGPSVRSRPTDRNITVVLKPCWISFWAVLHCIYYRAMDLPSCPLWNKLPALLDRIHLSKIQKVWSKTHSPGVLGEILHMFVTLKVMNIQFFAINVHFKWNPVLCRDVNAAYWKSTKLKVSALSPSRLCPSLPLWCQVGSERVNGITMVTFHCLFNVTASLFIQRQ